MQYSYRMMKYIEYLPNSLSKSYPKGVSILDGLNLIGHDVVGPFGQSLIYWVSSKKKKKKKKKRTDDTFS